jgi:hypothetical protein
VEDELKQVRLRNALVPLLFALPLRAQHAATVPASSGVYDRLEAVSALFPARGVFLGERPLSRRELRRAIARLSAAIDGAPASVGSGRTEWARRELGAVAAALETDRGLSRSPRLTVGASMRAEVFASDALSERITPNGLGQIDAVSHPFGARRDGWPTGQGTVASVATSGLLATGDALAIVVEPRFSVGHFRDGAPAEDVILQRAYARGVTHNMALQIGVDDRMWGQSPVSALFFSGNALAPPALVLGTDTAIVLPWLFRLAGPVRFTGLLADLGPAQDPPHARLAGWQVSIAPWPRFELGVSVLAQTGGADCASRNTCASFFKRLVDLFPVIDALAPQHADIQVSNKLAGGNLRLRFPELSGLDVYYELQIDDFDGRRLRSSFVDDAAHLLGARLPIITQRGQLSWRVELHRTSLRLYEHTQYRSGVTYRERLIGDPLGPNAKGAYLSVAWRPSPLNALEVALADESRDPSQYMTTSSDPLDRTFRFVRLTDEPHDRRRRATASIERAVGNDAGALRLTLGYNRAWRAGGSARNEWLGQIALRSHRLPTF